MADKLGISPSTKLTVPQLERLEAARTWSMSIKLHTSDTRANHVADTVLLLDRELRRVAVDETGAHEFPSIPPEQRRVAAHEGEELHASHEKRLLSHEKRPLPPSETGLRIARAETGSLDLLLEPYGFLVQVLTSHPFTALVSLMVFLSETRRFWRWAFGRHHGPDTRATDETIAGFYETVTAALSEPRTITATLKTGDTEIEFEIRPVTPREPRTG